MKENQKTQNMGASWWLVGWENRGEILPYKKYKDI
jgi:hypothetical protein